MIEYLLIAPWVVGAMYALAVVYAIYLLVRLIFYLTSQSPTSPLAKIIVNSPLTALIGWWENAASKNGATLG